MRTVSVRNRWQTGVEFEVLEPPELAEHVRSMAGRLGRVAGQAAT
ncbi:hypothetical protein [Planosporangium mesophilum]|nr:hypothetical protein [Planosporangium mesophilum]